MYPGDGTDPKGFNVDVLSGVTVIVGTNGIGKTTLLNLLLWMLTGPYVPRKADLLKPGSGQHRRTHLKSFDYFIKRAQQLIPDGEATLGLVFGDSDRVVIRRSLSNLKILDLWHNDTQLMDADEDRYLDLVMELSRTTSDWDYDFVVRHLIFFLEEKASLLWSEQGQYELLRILFFEETLSSQSVELVDWINKLDSQIRNRDWQLDDDREELAALDAVAGGDPDTGDNLSALQTRLTTINEGLLELGFLEGRLANVVSELEKEVFADEQTLDELQLSLRRTEQAYFRQAFPKLPKTTELVLGHLVAGGTCLVCRSDSQAAYAKLRKLQEQHACPVCETPQMEDVAPVTPIAQKQLEVLQGQANERQRSLREKSQRLDDARAGWLAVKNDQRAHWRDQAQLSGKVADLQSQLPPSDFASALRAKVESAEQSLQEDRAKLQLARRHLNVVLRTAARRIKAVARNICDEFSTFATTFLEEDCVLEYVMDRRPVGQTGARMDFPSFQLKMSSAVANAPSIRSDAGAVSESQKEFLDLAFRMAVMRVASSQKSPCMLVIETPEASLDTHFVSRAGTMLREFTSDGTIQHSVIASSNLNRENMIAELLGVDSIAPKDRATAVRPRIINLLKLAAVPKALSRNLQEYEGRLKAIIDG